jgi:uncharacterized protein (TIRG00374 family)
MKFLLKLTVAIGLLYWLVINGKLDFSLLAEIFKYPALVTISALLCMIQILLCSYRWGIMLKMKAPELTSSKILSTQWIGQFFSSILPGAVTGDIIKVAHLVKDHKNLSRPYLLFTILLDRVIGLCALLSISTVSGIFLYNELVEINPIFKEVILLNIFLFTGSLTFLALFFLKKNHQTFILNLIKHDKIRSTLASWWEIGAHKKKFFDMFALSVLAHTCAILSFYCINKHFFNESFQFKHLFAIVPMGQVGVAIPISPGGLGVGHVLFDKLFSFLNQSRGASLFNLAWMIAFTVNMLGLIPYLFHKNEKRPTIFLRRWAFFKL